MSYEKPVARGDEFVMVCENVTHEQEVYSLAQRVSDALSAALKALPCTAAQGYYIAAPLPPEACPAPAT